MGKNKKKKGGNNQQTTNTVIINGITVTSVPNKNKKKQDSGSPSTATNLQAYNAKPVKDYNSQLRKHGSDKELARPDDQGNNVSGQNVSENWEDESIYVNFDITAADEQPAENINKKRPASTKPQEYRAHSHADTKSYGHDTMHQSLQSNVWNAGRNPLSKSKPADVWPSVNQEKPLSNDGTWKHLGQSTSKKVDENKGDYQPLATTAVPSTGIWSNLDQSDSKPFLTTNYDNAGYHHAFISENATAIADQFGSSSPWGCSDQPNLQKFQNITDYDKTGFEDSVNAPVDRHRSGQEYCDRSVSQFQKTHDGRNWMPHSRGKFTKDRESSEQSVAKQFRNTSVTTDLDNSGNDDWFNDNKFNNRKHERSRNVRHDNRDSVRSGNKSEDVDYSNCMQFGKELKNHVYLKVTEIESDLFELPKQYSLAHCVAEDMAMGSGIAVQFRRDFKRVDELYAQKARQGGLAILEENERFIYYLVTKRISTGKPTYKTLFESLVKMRKHIDYYKVKMVAMPRIGCGLDRLEWSTVKPMLEYIFMNSDVIITVCNFQQLEPGEDYPTSYPLRLKRSRVENVNYPLVQIEPGTVIIYLGYEDGHVSTEMEELNNKFTFLSGIKHQRKAVGDIVTTYKDNEQYLLCGFIISKSHCDEFNFINFQKCIVALNKLNSKADHKYSYVGIQAILGDDELLMNKITSLLSYGLRFVDVYVCWPGDLEKYMPRARQN